MANKYSEAEYKKVVAWAQKHPVGKWAGGTTKYAKDADLAAATSVSLGSVKLIMDAAKKAGELDKRPKGTPSATAPRKSGKGAKAESTGHKGLDAYLRANPFKEPEKAPSPGLDARQKLRIEIQTAAGATETTIARLAHESKLATAYHARLAELDNLTKDERTDLEELTKAFADHGKPLEDLRPKGSRSSAGSRKSPGPAE